MKIETLIILLDQQRRIMAYLNSVQAGVAVEYGERTSRPYRDPVRYGGRIATKVRPSGGTFKERKE